MPFYGDLRTVSLVDLLHWASKNQKTGVLEIERNAISKRVEFRHGWVGSCSSNDPSGVLGQYLLARGRVNEMQLQHLLTLQRVVNKRLGLLLVEMGVLDRQEMADVVATKARETIHSLFDWDDAYFRFDEGASLDPDQIEVNLSVEELVEEGRRRCEILDRIRASFKSSGVVLSRSGLEVPAELLDSRVTKRIFEAIDGERSLADMLLHTRASEFLVLQFIHTLFERGLLSIREIRDTPADAATLLDVRQAQTARALDTPIAAGELDRVLVEIEPLDQPTKGAELDVEVDTALKLIEDGQFEPAVELLRSTCREHSTDYVRSLLLRAETSLVDSLQQDDSLTSVPVLRQDRHVLMHRDFSPEETFLLSLVDGSTDVQSVLWLAPLREVDTLMTLRRLQRNNIIELAEPTAEATEEPAVVLA